MKKSLWIFMVLLLLAVQSRAQTMEEVLKPVTKTYALRNVTIVQKPGQVIEGGTVIIKNGLIEAVGKNVSVPPGAKVLETDSMYVYAGFIDAFSNTGIPAPQTGRGGNSGFRRPSNSSSGERVSRSNPTREQAGLLPETPVRSKIKPDDKSVAALRKLGFTTAHTIPLGRPLPGKGAVILLAGESIDDMILKEDVSMAAELQGAGRVYPSTTIAVMSVFREMYKQAEQAKKHSEAYAAKPAGMPRPERDPALEAFFPVIEGKQPVFFKAEDVKTAYRVMVLQKELGFPLVLGGLKEGWHVTDQLQGEHVQTILSLDLPEEPKEEKKGKGKDQEEKTKEKKDPEMEALEKRRAEAMEQLVSQAAVLAQKGISFGLSTMDASAKDIHANLLRMIKAGLTEDQALAALTTTPAKMLGLAGSMGTVEKGKMANLVVSDKSYFDEKSNVRFVIVDGQVFEYEAPKKKANSSKEEVEQK